ncbi:tyrosine-type recombinase/integrase [Rhodanobacter sp. Si-c]|uniref:Tyrosine-type recombinase/integrase n=1 Tax=Rhodanobacter lycopersici TaxID=3162487 RepID=A0ABV3QIX0_9GAMM
MPIVACIDRYWLQRGQFLPSRDTAKRSITLWREYWGDTRTITDLTAGAQEDFTTWLSSKGYSDGYVRRVIGVGQTALNRSWKRGEVRQVPFVQLPQGGEAYPHHASRAQLVTLLNTPMPKHMRTYTLIRLCTGCRGDAALDLQPFQVQWDDKLIHLNPAGRRQTKKYRPVVPLTRVLAAHLKTCSAASHYVNWCGRPVGSIRTTWRKIRKAAELPTWFAPKVLRHTVASELRRRGVPGWEVSGLIGHKRGEAAATTGGYAKYDPAYLGKARKALDAWLTDLAKDVPWLRGVSAGSVDAGNRNGAKPESRAVAGSKVVGGTRIELVTPTMSR